MKFFRKVKQGMMAFGHSIAAIVNTVFLLIVYLVGVGITSSIAKLFKKKFLKTKLEKKSYWESLHLKKKALETYYRQF